jgi:serine protease
VCDPTDSNCAKDRQGHGTHCAGTVASKTYGVAKEATIHAVKVLGDDGSGQLSWMIDAMDWVTRHATKPAVISMSLGGKGGSKVEEAAVKRAVDAGITVVVAAGNDNDNACRYSPAFVKDAITVGATSSGDARASYSNFGSCVQIYAPGTNIKSLWHAGSSFSSSMPTKTISGTSMACPHVSGAAALLLGEDASLTPAKVTEKLVAASVKNVISGLTRQCPNKLLSVTDPVEEEPDEKDPISPPSKTCSEQAVHETPDSDGDCMCPYGMYCSVDGRSMSPCPFTSTWRKWLDIRYDFYAHTCTTCKCIHPYY